MDVCLVWIIHQFSFHFDPINGKWCIKSTNMNRVVLIFRKQLNAKLSSILCNLFNLHSLINVKKKRNFQRPHKIVKQNIMRIQNNYQITCI